MAENVVFNIEVQGGKTVTLPTAGKYVDRNIVITATGGGSGSGENILQTVINGTKRCQYLFYYYSEPNVDFLADIDTSNVTNMSYMFQNSSVESVPFLNMTNVTNVSNMFSNCRQLKNAPEIAENKITDFGNVFYQCTSLEGTLKVNTSNATNMNNAFYTCVKVNTIELSSLDKINSAMSGTFQYCRSLTKLIIRNMTKIIPINSTTFQYCDRINGTVNSIYNPDGIQDGYIYVPDDWVEKLKSVTNWSAIATQIKPISELPDEE